MRPKKLQQLEERNPGKIGRTYQAISWRQGTRLASPLPTSHIRSRPRGYQKDKKKGPYLSNTQGRGLSKKNPAATDSPTGLPLQYHRRWRT